MVDKGERSVAGNVGGRFKRVALMALVAFALVLGLSTSASAVAPAPPEVGSIAPDFGPTGGGTEVTILGSDFRDGPGGAVTAVEFGGVAATSFTIHSDTYIAATAPAQAVAGTVDVILTNGDGPSSAGTAADDFTYIDVPTVTDLEPILGPAAGGTQVIITGTDFATTTSVTFGGVEAGFSIDSDTKITAVSPPHAGGIVSVLVTNGGGTSANTEDDNFKYMGIPTITSLSPTYGPIAGGTAVTINGTGLLTATEVMFGEDEATIVGIDSDTKMRVTSPAHDAGTVRVKVTTSYGSTADTVADNYAYIEGIRYQQSDSKMTRAGVWSFSTVAYASGGSYIHTSQPGAAVVATFTGTSVKVIAKKCPWYGKALIKVDGGSEEEVDLYSSAWYGNWQQTVYSRTGLAYGAHTITIECMGEKSSAAWATTICLDALDITGALTQAPSIVKIDDKDAACVYDADWKRWDNSGYWAAYLDTYAFTDKDNAEMTFTFDGTFASWIAYTSMTKGKAEVTLDPGTAGERTTTIDLCTPGHQWKKNVYSTGILADGTHELVIKCLREKSWWAWWYTVDVDRFEILED